MEEHRHTEESRKKKKKKNNLFIYGDVVTRVHVKYSKKKKCMCFFAAKNHLSRPKTVKNATSHFLFGSCRVILTALQLNSAFLSRNITAKWDKKEKNVFIYSFFYAW